MKARERRRIASELRGLRLIGGGLGCVWFCSRRGLILSAPACEALARAATRLGFANRRNRGWGAVTVALAQKSLRAVIDDAMAELEKRP